MATKTTKYGRLLTLRVATIQIDNLMTTGFNQSRDTRETTTKDSADNEEHEVTIMRRTVPFSGYASEASAVGAGFVALQGWFTNGTTVAWKVSTGTGGDHYWSGSGSVVKLDFTAPHDGNVEFSGEIKVNGVVTFGVD